LTIAVGASSDGYPEARDFIAAVANMSEHPTWNFNP
jgi:hypothetical protein